MRAKQFFSFRFGLFLGVILLLLVFTLQRMQEDGSHAAATSCGTSPSGQAMPVGDMAGWHQVFADNFNGTTLDTSKWGTYSGQPGGDPAGWWDPSHVIVNNCLLTLRGYQDPAVKSGLFVTGGIGMRSAYTQPYGKYLVRMRADKGNGLSTIALLWPQANVWPPEIDFYEDAGDRRSMTATLHCGSNGNDNCQVQKGLTRYDFSQWHTIGVEWTAGNLVYTIDGTTWATVTNSAVPSIPMALDLQTEARVNSSTSPEVDMQVAWVVAYAPSSATPTLTRTPSPATTKHAPSPTILPSFPPGPVNKTWYFAEGRVGKGFKEYVTLGNPLSTPCSVNVEYMLAPDSGSPSTRTIPVTVPGGSRVTQYVNTDLSVAQSQTTGVSVSALVQVNPTATPNCTGIVAERPMYFNALGVNSGDDVMGATHTASTFYFADVPTGGGYSSFLTILNPGNSPASVTTTYYAGGSQVGTQMTTVAPNARGTILPNNRGLPAHVAAVVSSTQPIVMERPDYFSHINGGNAGTVSGAAVVVGTSTLANDWLLAEGYTGTHYQEKLVMANLDTVANTSANVTIKLDFATGGARTFHLSLARLSQVIWDVNAAVGPNQAVSAEVLATGANIVVEREMFFQSSFTVNGVSSVAMGGSEVNGQVGPASHSSYSFAEGYTNTGYKEWLTLQNPTASAQTIYVTLVNGYGRSYTYAASASPNSRTTVDINGLVVAHLLHSGEKYPGYEVSMTVQTLNGAPFVAERPMYWNASGTQGGSVTIGYIGG